MQAYATAFFIAALSSACFIDAAAEIAKIGKVATVIFTVLFLVTEGVALFS